MNFHKPLDLINHVCIAVTWDCNLKCKFCSIWKKKTHEFIDPDEFIEQFKKSGVDYPLFAVYGGEPTLHPKIVYFYEKLEESFPDVAKSIVTNGYGKAHKILKELSVVNKNLITCVSIDGTRDRHDAHRGVAGSYDYALNSMDICFDNFNRPARVSYTITPDNIKDIPHAVKIAKHYSSDLSMRVATDGNYFNGEIKIKWHKWDIDRLERELEKIYPTLLCSARFVYSIPEFLRTGEHLDCVAPYRSLDIMPNLDIKICHTREPICKLKDVKDYWYRDKRHIECINSSCFTKNCFIDSMYALTYS